jgi:hypothetical protein
VTVTLKVTVTSIFYKIKMPQGAPAAGKDLERKKITYLRAAGALTGTPLAMKPLTTTKSKHVPRLAWIITSGL